MGITISVPAVRLSTPLDAIVKLVPSPSIFSPSSPKVRPTLEGIFISFDAVRFISVPLPKVKSVPSPETYSPASANWSFLPLAT